MEAASNKPAHDRASEDRPAVTIARDIVKTLKRDFGRGPTQARTYLHDDCVLVVLREGHTATERTMEKAGEQRTVAQGRVDVSEIIREPLSSVVERTVGRKVVGFMPSSQQDPELCSYVFVFEASPLVAAD